MKTTKQNVIAFVEANSYFQVDDKEAPSFTTRRHGNVGDCQHSAIDVRKAVMIGDALKKEFKNLSYSIDICDGWVNLYISITETKK